MANLHHADDVIPFEESYNKRPNAVRSTATTASTLLYQASDENHRRYIASFVAGGLSSSVRWALVPLEVVKTKLQVQGGGHGGGGMIGSIQSVYRADGWRGLTRGLAPTAMAYGVQTSTKYGCYEIFKDHLTPHTDDGNSSHHVWMYNALAAGLAEATADVLMCPFEMVRVRMQTAAFVQDNKRPFPQRFVPAVLQMARNAKFYQFPFGAIRPIWMRQIPGTMVNFCLFESTATFLYDNALDRVAAECTVSQQVAVTLTAGTVAGIVSSIVSHPADSIISLLSSSSSSSLTNHHTHHHHNLRGGGGTTTISGIIQQVGWYRLATRGLWPRMLITTNIICGQWLLYGTFKNLFVSDHASAGHAH